MGTTRMRYPEVAPEGYAALQAFGHYCNSATSLEPVLLGLVYLRASILNGCEFCVGAHAAELRKHNEPESRIRAAGEGVDSDAFTPRERAALVWTDVLTQLQGGPATDVEYAAVSAFFRGKDLVDLTFAIANINAWNRMGVAFRPEWRGRPAGIAAGGTMEHGVAPVGAAGKIGSPAMRETVNEADDDGGKVAQD